MSGNCDFFKGQLGGHQVEILPTLTRLVLPANIHGNWKADQYGICVQLCGQNDLFQFAEDFCQPGPIGPPTLTNVEVNRTLLAGEIGPR